MFRNFFDIHEVCLYADYPIVPRKWLEGTEIWADCHGPDTYQECDAIYLVKYGYHRNVPLLDIVVGGDEAGENLSPERARAQGTCLAWDYSLSAVMQERFARAARRLQLFIMAHELGLQQYEILEDAQNKAMSLVENEHVHARVFYPIDYVGVAFDHFDYIARRKWQYSLWGKSAAYKIAVHAYRFAHGAWRLIVRILKLPVGLALGFPRKALIASFLDTDPTLRNLVFRLGNKRVKIRSFASRLKARLRSRLRGNAGK